MPIVAWSSRHEPLEYWAELAGFFSAEHQAWRKSMGQPSSFDLPRTPTPTPFIAPSLLFIAPSPALTVGRFVPVSPGVAVSKGSDAAPRESVGLLETALLIVKLGGSIAVGVMSESWLVGFACFVLVSLLLSRVEAFLETEAGRVVEGIFCWSLGLSFLGFAAFALYSEGLITSPEVRVWIVLMLIVTAARAAYRLWTAVSGRDREPADADWQIIAGQFVTNKR
jgi:hypothetical protein